MIILHRLHVSCSLGLILGKLDSSYKFGHGNIILVQVFDRFITMFKITGSGKILNLISPALNMVIFAILRKQQHVNLIVLVEDWRNMKIANIIK